MMFEKAAQSFFANIKNKMDRANIAFPDHWAFDHICYRVDTSENYLKKKIEFADQGTLLIESEVAGRPISTFKLNKPLVFLGRKIDLLELPAPKQGQSIKQGFEHFEVVCDQSFEKLVQQFPQAQFNTKGANKDFNAELQIQIDDLAIKFHHQSLESVVNLEKNTRVWEALKSSGVLKDCKKFTPLVAGTFPLGVETTTSDLDIVMFHTDLKEIQSELSQLYSSYREFETYLARKNNRDYGVVRFTFAEVPFEIYFEQTPSLQQRGFVHFQIEERLLKLGGPPFKQKVQKMRSQGLKTEPAFIQALGIVCENPYLKLLELHSWSERQLEELF
jgi:uncharacterized protein